MGILLLNQKQNIISEYKEKMTRRAPYMLTLLMFVEGKQWIRSAGVVGEKEKEKKRRKMRMESHRGHMVCERKIERR